MLKEHVRRWGIDKTRWLVELLFDDLLVWTNWIRDRRTIAVPTTATTSQTQTDPSSGNEGLIALGSDNLTGVVVQSGNPCSTLHALWESGLDNSPM